MPATKAAMNPFPSMASATANAVRAIAERRPGVDLQSAIHARSAARVMSAAPPTPRTRPTISPTPSSRRATPASNDALSLTVPSWLAATASMTVTIGVAMPSFSPLSTFRARRSRIGIRSSLIT